jgi:pimeloyl-ACP methyl ester carboxylesterase
MRKWPSIGLILGALLAAQCGNDTHQGSGSSPTSRYVKRARGKRVFVFVHGILGDAEETWKNSKSISFPELVASDLDMAGSDVYVYGYPSRFFSAGPFSLPEIAANMESRLKQDKVFQSHEEVIFVCHSMGGLVVLQMLLTYRNLAAKVPLMALYSTPQTGAEIAKLGSAFSQSRQLEAMLPGEDNQFLESLERQWRTAEFKTVVRCAYERRPTKKIMVVDRASGTRLCDGSTVPIDADHVGIVKPRNREDDSYVALSNWVKDLDSAEAPGSGDSSDDFPRMVTPRAMALSDLIQVLEDREEVTIVFRGCPNSLLSAEVPRGTYEGTSLKELLENVRLRIEGPEVQYKVRTVKEGLRYEIWCDQSE